ncbi:MAG TPA: DUF6599 family protein [Terriglobia bacterium]|nr:DUF6599 family protein [Terriglobia bacterium]
MSWLIVWSLTHCLAPGAVWAQTPSVMPLVPAANWKLTSSTKSSVSVVSNWGGDPKIEEEYGVKSVEARSYRLDDELSGSQTADVVVEETPDASAVYGLLTYYQTEAMIPEKGIQLAVVDANSALMARGRVFIHFVKGTGSHISTDEFRALETLVGGTRPTADALASLPAPLPPRGLVPGTEKYLLGTQAAARVLPSFPAALFGFEQGAEVQTGRYAVDSRGGATSANQPATLLAIEYPTSQIARARFELMQNALGLNKERGAESVYGKRTGSFVFLAINAGSKTSGTKLLDQFNVAEQVSWDQRYPGKKSITLQMLELILANLGLVALLISAAVLGGSLIALSKRLARKWFPSSEWGSPEGERLITLNLR